MTDATYMDDLPEEGFQLTAGMYVSGVAHVALLGWLLSGWGLSQEPLPFEVMDVSIVSEAEFEALFPDSAPEAVAEAPSALAAPVADTSVPEVTPEVPVATATPEPAPAPPEQDAPPPSIPEPQPPVAEVDDTLPTLITPPAPPPGQADLPVTDTPAPPQADRIASDITLPPPPDADVAPEVQQQSTPEADVPEVVQEEQEAAAPEETTTEIVTEAEEPSGAVTTSLRPPSRPERAAPVVEDVPATPGQVSTADSDSVVDDAVAEALAAEIAGAASEDVPLGPPMTSGERDGFRLAVQDCWVVDPGSQAARVTVVVAFSLTPEGRVEGNVVEMIENSGGDAAAVNAAFEAARRAVLRCQSSGYDLPPEKYGQWQNVELVFDPSGMRLR